ncbi:hypothetical protein ACSBR1_005155 [Camellia fascicularis]
MKLQFFACRDGLLLKALENVACRSGDSAESKPSFALTTKSYRLINGPEMNSHDLQTMCFKFLKDLPLDHIRAQPNTLITMSCDVNQEEADHEQKEGESKKYTKYVIEKVF